MGDLARAVEYYGRALDAVQCLYRQHPLVGTLTSRLYFCSEALARKSGACTAHEHHLLAKSYASFCEMYGRDATALLLPLLGYEQSDPAFASVIQDLVQVKDEEKSLLENSRFLWPPGLYESIGRVPASKGTTEDFALSHNSLLSSNQNLSHFVPCQNQQHQSPVLSSSSLFVNCCYDCQHSPLQTSPLHPLSSPLPPAPNPPLMVQRQMINTTRSDVFGKSNEALRIPECFSLANTDGVKKYSGYT